MNIPDFVTYQQLALRTEKTPVFVGDLPRSRFAHGAIGICTEIGELQDALKKHIIYGRDLDPVNIMEECGDIAWYIALVADAADLSLMPSETLYTQNTGALAGDLRKKELLDCAFLLGNENGWFQYACSRLETDGMPEQVQASNGIAALLHLGATILNACGYTWKDACERNIAKLAKRYGEKFSEFAALNRDLGAERQELER